MPTYEINLKSFIFPDKLPDDKANFRFIVDLRYIDETNEFVTEHAVMPSLDTFWECAKDKREKPNYVRDETNPQFRFDNGNTDGNEQKGGDGNKPKGIDEWDRLIFHIKGKSLHSIQFKVIDVNRKDAWDTVRNVLGKVVEVAIGKMQGILPTSSLWSRPLGAASGDVQSFLLKKLAGGDKVLFRGSAKFDGKPEATIKGAGTRGAYEIKIKVTGNKGSRRRERHV